MAQSVERPTLGFSSGHDLTVMSSSPALGPALPVRSLLAILSPSLYAPPALARSLSLSHKLNKLKIF